jgi:hypothetical protein
LGNGRDQLSTGFLSGRWFVAHNTTRGRSAPYEKPGGKTGQTCDRQRAASDQTTSRFFDDRSGCTELFNGRAHCGRVTPAVRGIRLERLIDQRVPARIEPGNYTARIGKSTLGSLSHQQLVGNDADRIQVGMRIGFAAFPHFRRHIRRSSGED